MLLVEAQALVTYTCTLTDKDEKAVRAYAKKNDVSLDEAIKALWDEDKIDIYAGEQTESDCHTQEVGYSGFND